MEKLLKIVFVILLSFSLSPIFAANDIDASESSNTFNWDPIVHAIIKVESNGNSNARHGSSVGVLQITPVLVCECNNILKSRNSKKRYKLADRYNVAKSIEMFLLIQSKYNPENNVEKAIRSWNGGIHYSIKRTERYLNKVMTALKRL